MVARVASLADPLQRAQFDQLRQITRRRRRGSFGDRAIIMGAESPDEAIRPFRHHADQRLFLARIDPAAQTIKQAGLLNEEPDALYRTPMRLQHDTGEPTQPVIDPVALAGPLQLGVISLAYAD